MQITGVTADLGAAFGYMDAFAVMSLEENIIEC